MQKEQHFIPYTSITWIDSHVIQTIAPSSGSGSSMQYIQLSTWDNKTNKLKNTEV